MKTSHKWFLLNSGGGATNNSYVQAWLDKLIIEAYSLPSLNYINKINLAFNYAETNGLLTLLDCFYLFNNDGSIEASTINLIDPLNLQLTLYNSPVWTSGVKIKFNGTNNYAQNSNNLNTYGKYSLNSASVGMYVVDPGIGSSKIAIGAYETASGYFSQLSNLDSYYLINVKTPSKKVLSSNFGHIMASKYDSANQAIALNGVEEFNYAALSVGIPSLALSIGRRNQNPTPSFYWDGSLAFAYVGQSLRSKTVQMNTFINMLL